LARPDPTKRTVWAIGQQRKDDNRHHREADTSSQTRVVDAGYHGMQPRLLDQKKRSDRHNGAGQYELTSSCQDAS
jgi:hypothetical protein